MEMMNAYTLGFNSPEMLTADTSAENGIRIPMDQNNGELLIFVDATGAGTLDFSAGNTVFGGKSRSIELPEAGDFLIRLEVGPHLIKDETGCYIHFTGPSAIGACAIRLK